MSYIFTAIAGHVPTSITSSPHQFRDEESTPMEWHVLVVVEEMGDRVMINIRSGAVDVREITRYLTGVSRSTVDLAHITIKPHMQR